MKSLCRTRSGSVAARVHRITTRFRGGASICLQMRRTASDSKKIENHRFMELGELSNRIQLSRLTCSVRITRNRFKFRKRSAQIIVAVASERYALQDLRVASLLHNRETYASTLVNLFPSHVPVVSSVVGGQGLRSERPVLSMFFKRTGKNALGVQISAPNIGPALTFHTWIILTLAHHPRLAWLQ